MQLQTQAFDFILLTPCFSGTALGKDSNKAEMRVPPIRGHVRFWHRELFPAPDANRVWGSAGDNQSHGSRVGLRLLGKVSGLQERSSILPHKHHGGTRAALKAGQEYHLEIQRLIGCREEDWDHAIRSVRLWLLVGNLGLRSNRAAGSVWPKGDWVPQSPQGLRRILTDLGFKWPVQLVDTKDKSAEELRTLASNTIRRSDLFGDSTPRKPSPTKFKVIQFDGQPRLLVTAPLSVNLSKVREELSGRDKAGEFSWNPL